MDEQVTIYDKQITIYDVVDCFLNRLIDGPDKTTHDQVARKAFIVMSDIATGDKNMIDEKLNVLTKLMAVSGLLDYDDVKLPIRTYYRQ